MIRPLVLFFMLFGLVPLARSCPIPNARVVLHEFPPFYYRDAAGTPQGTLVTLLERAMQRMGCQWHTQFTSVPRLLADISNGQGDIAMIIRHPALEHRAYYGDVVVGELVLKLYHQPDLPAFERLADLPRNTRLIIRRGYGFNGLVDRLIRPESGMRLVLADSHQQAVEMLKQRQGDYLLNYQGPTQYYLNLNGMYHIEGNAIASWPIYPVLSSKLANGAELAKRLDEELRQLLTEDQ